ncbi:MAG: MFS transporter [Halobacteriota archaeon]
MEAGIDESERVPRGRMLAVAATSLFLSTLVWFNYSAVLPLIVAEWELTGTAAGIIFGAFQAGYLLAIVPVGVLVDRYAARPFIAGGAAITGAASLTFAAVSTGFLDGSLLRFVAGIGMAGVYVPGMRFVTGWYGASARGRAMGIYVGTFSLGSALSFFAGSTIAAQVGWRGAIAATSVGALLVAPLILLVGRDPPGRTEAVEGGFDFGVLRNREYLAAVGTYTFHNWELFGVRNWLLAFLLVTPAVATTGSPEATAGVLVGLMIAVGGLGNVIGGTASDRVGRLTVIASGLAISGVVSATLGVLTWLPLWAFVAVLLVYGVALTMDSAPTSTLVTEIVSDDQIGTALSIQSFVGFSSTIVSPVLFGIALDRWGYELAFPTLAVGALLALACVVVLRSAAPAVRRA